MTEVSLLHVVSPKGGSPPTTSSSPTSRPGAGPLALCLHGFPDSAWTYRYLLPALADAGFRAVAPFMRGYAPTAVPADGRYQTGALGLDACALHEALGGDGDAVIIGHDWGAMATYTAANHEPDRWRRVVTMAVPPSGAVGGGLHAVPPAEEELVHVLLPARPVRHGRRHGRPRVHRRAVGGLVARATTAPRTSPT